MGSGHFMGEKWPSFLRFAVMVSRQWPLFCEKWPLSTLIALCSVGDMAEIARSKEIGGDRKSFKDEAQASITSRGQNG